VPGSAAGCELAARAGARYLPARGVAARAAAHLREELGQIFLERERADRRRAGGAAAAQHVLVIGPPGTAKSMLADEVCGG